MNSNSQSWNHYKKIRQQGKCTCTRLHKAAIISPTLSSHPMHCNIIKATQHLKIMIWV